MKNGDFIRNKKTGKIGIVVDSNYGNSGILKWAIASTQNHHHICISPHERFESWSPKEFEYLWMMNHEDVMVLVYVERWEHGLQGIGLDGELVNILTDGDYQNDKCEPFIGQLPLSLKKDSSNADVV